VRPANKAATTDIEFIIRSTTVLSWDEYEETPAATQADQAVIANAVQKQMDAEAVAAQQAAAERQAAAEKQAAAEQAAQQAAAAKQRNKRLRQKSLHLQPQPLQSSQ
jgi:hypothetical protein